MVTSDKDGVVVFPAREGNYKFQILSMPEGYELDRRFEGTSAAGVEVRV